MNIHEQPQLGEAGHQNLTGAPLRVAVVRARQPKASTAKQKSPTLGASGKRDKCDPEDELSPLDDSLVIDVRIVQAIRGFEEIRRRIFAIRIEFLVYAIGIDRE